MGDASKIIAAYRAPKRVKFTMDQASWHRSKALKIPDNLRILLLPPYSPELNPVERLWEHAKSKLIKTKIYDTLDDLEDSVFEFFRTLKNKSVQTICNFKYLN